MMDGYELRKHIGNITELLSEILAEIKGLRMDYKEQQEFITCSSGEPLVEIDFGINLQTFKGIA